MPLVPRIIVCFLVALLGFIGLIHYEKWPAETYAPPPMLYQNATSTAYGDVTGTETKDLGDHLFEGSDTFYYMDYEFHPYIYTMDKHGYRRVSTSPTAYNGAVRVTFNDFNTVTKGTPVTVKYDPIDPNINGVPDTMGLWSKTTGYFNSYLWYYLGVLVVGFILQEIVRMITKTNDLG
jgi:hypothetical protein